MYFYAKMQFYKFSLQPLALKENKFINLNTNTFILETNDISNKSDREEKDQLNKIKHKQITLKSILIQNRENKL